MPRITPHADTISPPEKRTLFQCILEQLPEAVMVVDIGHDCVVEANLAACAWFGYSRDRLLAMRASALFGEQSAAIGALAKSMQGKSAELTLQLSCQAQGGEPITVRLLSVDSSLDGGGSLLAVVREGDTRSSVDHILRAIVEGTASVTGDEFFHTLVRNLAEVLGVRYAFVAEFTGVKTRVRTLALWARDRIVDNIEYDLAGTPCEAVLGGEIRHYPQNIQAIFPENRDLVEMEAESFLAIPLVNSTGNVLGHLAVVDDKPMPVVPRDLSIFRIFAARAMAELERKWMQQALEDSERRYRDLYKEAPVAYLSVNTNGLIQQANRYATQLFGYRHEELIGRRVFELVADTPAGKPVAQTVFERFLAGQETHDQELEMRSRNGRQVWVSLSVTPIRDPTGNVMATRSLLVDITERKRAEAALQHSERRLATILATAMDAVITIDADHHIVLFNAAAEKTFRCSADWAIGQPFDRFLSKKFRSLLQRYLESLRSQDDTQRQLWAPQGITALRANGEEFPIETTVSSLEISGKRFYTIILRDVDDRKDAENMLRRLRLENVYLQEELRSEHNFEDIIGNSDAVQKVFAQIQKVAPADTTVLLTGETGTGKELIARAIHNLSTRRDKLLVKMNCAALPSELVESELFGHEKGAFTGATAQRKGRFELADGGTLFLDEVGELSAAAQAKLLRVLQEQEFERVGGSRTLQVNVRVITATNHDLEEMVRAGKFRADLFYRLSVFPIQLPALRERASDIPALVRYFLRKLEPRLGKPLKDITPRSMELLVRYQWPGNIRELQNVTERAAILSTGPIVEIDDAVILHSLRPEPAVEQPASATLEAVERSHIQHVLEATNWVIEGARGAAATLGLHPSTLRFRIQKLGITRPRAGR